MQIEIDAMKTLKDVMQWAGFDVDDMSSHKTVAGTLAMLLGVTETTAPRSLALVDGGDALAVKIDADGSCTCQSPHWSSCQRYTTSCHRAIRLIL